MTKEFYQVAKRIRYELEEIERIIKRVSEGWQRAKRSADDYYLDGVALNLHSFYSGLERIFELIATVVDGFKPKDKNWHKSLLQQMVIELSDIRPAVISQPIYDQLNDYRGFRHIVRNVYAFKFNSLKIEKLVKKAPHLFLQIKAELLAFANFLEQEV